MKLGVLMALLLSAKGDALKGRVELVGTAQVPSLNLVTDDGRRFEVVGDLVAELGTLQGAPKLELNVAREREGMLPRVRVLSYKVLDVGGGDKPEVGIVSVHEGKVSLTLDDKSKLDLMETQVSRKLLTRHGEKVWVVGKATSSGFKVWRVGFIAMKPVDVKPVEPSSQPASKPATEGDGQ